MDIDSKFHERQYFGEWIHSLIIRHSPIRRLEFPAEETSFDPLIVKNCIQLVEKGKLAIKFQTQACDLLIASHTSRDAFAVIGEDRSNRTIRQVLIFGSLPISPDLICANLLNIPKLDGCVISQSDLYSSFGVDCEFSSI